MSETLENVLVIEKMMDIERVSNPKNTVLIGPTQKTLFAYPASSQSNNSLIFNNICAPSLTTVMKRSIRIQMQAQVTVTCAAAAIAATDPQFNAINDTGAVYNPGGGIVNIPIGGKINVLGGNSNVCLRACPLGSVCSSADIRINGGSTNCSLDTYNLIYPFLQGKEDVSRYAGEMPLQCDNGTVYENTSATSPFLSLGYNSSVQPRGSFTARLRTSAGNPLVNTYLIEWTEELFVSPFLTGHNQDDVGLVNVNNLTISLRLENLNNMFSGLFSTGSIAVSLVAAGGAAAVSPANLLVEFCSQNSIIAQRTPQSAVYPYNQIQTYQSGIAALTKTTLPLTALRLPCQPSKIYVFIAPTTSARTTLIPDHFLHITGVSINFNDKNSLLNSMEESSLYEMSAFNASSDKGGFMSFNQWKWGCGSIVVIDVQRDLSVGDSAQSGTQNQFSTLQVTLTYDNQNCLYGGQTLAAGSYSAYQVVVSPGKLFLSPSQGEFVVLGPSPAEVLSLTASEDAVKIPEESAGEGSVDGKGFSDLVSKGLKLAWDNRSAIAEHVGPYVARGTEHLVRKLKGGEMSPISYSAGAVHRRA